jgi:RND family efflux transporter MFP subunit
MNSMFRLVRQADICAAGRFALAVCALGMWADPDLRGEVVEGFTEPYRVIHVASPESGILAELQVHEGDQVREAQVLASLDVEVHQAMLKIAEVSMESRGRLDSALAELAVRKNRLEKLRLLQSRGHARVEEVERAQADLAIAEGNVKSVREELRTKQLEYERIRVQLERRTIRSPLDGVVRQVLKRRGEFVAPNDPVVLQVVQLNPLAAVFMVSRRQAEDLALHPTATVRLGDGRRKTVGAVEFISPTIEAESGLVEVKIRLDNDDGSIRSGERCTVQVGRQ